MDSMSPKIAILLFVFGAASMSLELLASRLLAPFFGASIHVWGAIISSVMVQFAAGYLLGGYLCRRWGSVSLLVFCLLVASVWVMAMPFFTKNCLISVASTISDIRFGSLVGVNLLLFVPVTFMAMVSPYVIGLANLRGIVSGSFSGFVLFISTLGAFVGTNAVAFFLLEIWPVSRILFGIGALCFSCCSFFLLGMGKPLKPDVSHG